MARRRARARRGAVLVEALVVAPVLVLLWSAVLFLGYLYSQKLTTQGEARARAWSHALGSCAGGEANTVATQGADLDAVTADSEAPRDSALPSEGRDLAQDAEGAGDLEFGESWGVAEARSERAGGSFGVFSTGTIGTSRQVQCDETPRGADPRAVLSFLWDLRNTVNFN